MTKLFSPIKIGNIEIKNRVAMPPMVCFGKAGADGLVTEKNIAHYELRAANEVGLIITEAICINREGRLSDKQLGLWDDECIGGLGKLTKVCHSYGATIFAQIHHAGLDSDFGEKIAPSDYDIIGKNGDISGHARGISLDELKNLQGQFVDSALRAKKAGFDGVELHGAHGYLISQFFSPVVNKRTDEYGGSIENRVRFAAEIIKRVKIEAGADFVMGCRIGSCEPTIAEGIEIAKLLKEAGVDYLNVSTGYSTKVKPVVPEGFPGNWIAYGGVEIKKHVDLPVFAVNQIKTPEQAEFFIDREHVDIVCIGRGLLADPKWAKHVKDGEPIIECAGCRPCGWFKEGGKCPKNIEKL